MAEDGEAQSLRCCRAHQHRCRGRETVRQSSAPQACVGLAGKVPTKPTSAVWEGIFPLHYILPHSDCSAMWAPCHRVCSGRGGQAAGQFCPRQAKALLLLHNVLTVPRRQHLQQKSFIYPNVGLRRDIGCLRQPASAAFWGGQRRRQRRSSASISVESSTSGLQPQEQLFVRNIGALGVA